MKPGREWYLRLVFPVAVASAAGVFVGVAAPALDWSSVTVAAVGAALAAVLGLLGTPLIMLSAELGRMESINPLSHDLADGATNRGPAGGTRAFEDARTEGAHEGSVNLSRFPSLVRAVEMNVAQRDVEVVRAALERNLVAVRARGDLPAPEPHEPVQGTLDLGELVQQSLRSMSSVTVNTFDSALSMGTDVIPTGSSRGRRALPDARGGNTVPQPTS